MATNVVLVQNLGAEFDLGVLEANKIHVKVGPGLKHNATSWALEVDSTTLGSAITHTLSLAGTVLSSDVNGVVATQDLAAIAAGSLSASAGVQKVGADFSFDADSIPAAAAGALPPATKVVISGGNGELADLVQLSDALEVADPTTVAVTGAGTTLTTTVNGVAGAYDIAPLVAAATTNVVDTAANVLTSTVNGVADTAPIINSNVLSSPSGTILRSDVNGVQSDFDLAPLLASVDIYVNGGSYNAGTTTLTLTDTNGASPDVTVNLGDLKASNVTASIVGDGNGTPLSLDGDAAAPGNTKFYGTDAAGVKGWQDLATAVAGVTTNALTLTGAGVLSSTVNGVLSNTVDIAALATVELQDAFGVVLAHAFV